MTNGEIVYLALVLGSFISFAGLLAFAGWDEKRRQKRLGLHWYRKPE